MTKRDFRQEPVTTLEAGNFLQPLSGEFKEKMEGERESRNSPGFPTGKVHRKSPTPELQCVTKKKK